MNRADEHVRPAGIGGRGEGQSGDSDEESADHTFMFLTVPVQFLKQP